LTGFFAEGFLTTTFFTGVFLTATFFTGFALVAVFFTGFYQRMVQDRFFYVYQRADHMGDREELSRCCSS
jgi:hypothetical protein